MSKSRGIRAPRQYWTQEQLQILIDRYPHERTEDLVQLVKHPKASIYRTANKLGLKKTPEFQASIFSGRIQRGHTDPRVVGTRFPKGHEPANKGLRRPGYAPGRMKETQFKKGCRAGRAQKLYQPIGTERISRDGYLERKINDDMPLQKRWRAVHLILWEETNSPLPKGYAIAFKDGNKKNIALENLECISRAELMRRNSFDRYGKEIATLVRLKGAITRQINRREKKV